MTRRSVLIALALVVGLSGSSFAAGSVLLPRTGPLPIEFGGGILLYRDVFVNTQVARQAISKLVVATEKCLSKGVTNVSRGKPSGVTACLHDPRKGALPKYAAKIASLQTKPGGLPPCAGFHLRGAEIVEITRAFHEYAYCGDPPDLGSPSGAFLDGPRTL